MRGLHLPCHVSDLVSCEAAQHEREQDSSSMKSHTDHWVLNERFAKRVPLLCIRNRLFETDACKSGSLRDQAPALVVEIVHDALEPIIFLADEVLYWH